MASRNELLVCSLTHEVTVVRRGRYQCQYRSAAVLDLEFTRHLGAPPLYPFQPQTGTDVIGLS